MVSYLNFKKGLIGILTVLKRLILVFLAITILLVLPLRWVPPPTTSFMLQHQFKVWLKDKKYSKIRYQWVDLNNISIHAPIAVVAAEDQKFPMHWGFDRESIEEAWIERANGIRIRGASTITQQVAKNLFLWPGRSFLRKGVEAYFTTLIELLWPKRRIIEIYLNIAEFGNGVYGIKSAGKTFFKKPPRRLTRRECALLAAVLPNPKRLRAARPSNYVLKRTAWIHQEMDRLDRAKHMSNL
jgi:monofunctional biosynthetic peptidoglycan transglycosylase